MATVKRGFRIITATSSPTLTDFSATNEKANHIRIKNTGDTNDLVWSFLGGDTTWDYQLYNLGPGDEHVIDGIAFKGFSVISPLGTTAEVIWW